MWEVMSDAEKAQAQQDYPNALHCRRDYEEALKARLASAEFRTAPSELAKTVRDLEHRSLLQYDAQAKHYDLHPVVRGVAAGGLRQEEKEQYGQRVVDHFSRQVHNPYEEAETLDDVRDGLHIVRTLLQMGRYQEGADAFRGDLASALLFNLEAGAEVLSLLHPFFPHGWATLPDGLNNGIGSYLTNKAAVALHGTGQLGEALEAYSVALLSDLRSSAWSYLQASLSNISITLSAQNRLAKDERCCLLALDLATFLNDTNLFSARLARFAQLAQTGQWIDAEALWRLLDPMGRKWPRAAYRPGEAESLYARFRFWQGELREAHLVQADRLAREGKSPGTIRDLHSLSGAWRMQQGQWTLAVESLHEAVRMARAVGQPDTHSEAQLALAKFHLGQLPDPRHEAEQLSSAKEPAHGALANLWLAIGDLEQAEKHALAAYKRAWADGEPYVRRYELNQARTLLEQLGAEIPDLPPDESAQDEKLPWEDEVKAAIEKLRAEKEAEKADE